MNGSIHSSRGSFVPPPLRRGDTIAVVSPAGPVDRGLLRLGEKFLEQRGYHVMRGRHALERKGYLAGSDRQRLDDLNRAIADPAVQAIFFSRGGYGTTRILPGVEAAPLARHPKAILGYSDLTVLLNYLNRSTGLVTFLGPMVATDMGNGLRGKTLSAFHDMLEVNGKGRVVVRCPPGRAATGTRMGFLQPGRATALLTGGCLSMIVSTLGTEFQPILEGRILFLEEVNEPAYRIDRMLTQLFQAGLLEGLAGMIVGRLHQCDTRGPLGGRGVRRFLSQLLGPLRIPVFFGFPSGHGRQKVVLPLGLPVTLDSSRGLVSFKR